MHSVGWLVQSTPHIRITEHAWIFRWWLSLNFQAHWASSRSARAFTGEPRACPEQASEASASNGISPCTQHASGRSLRHAAQGRLFAPPENGSAQDDSTSERKALSQFQTESLLIFLIAGPSSCLKRSMAVIAPAQSFDFKPRVRSLP